MPCASRPLLLRSLVSHSEAQQRELRRWKRRWRRGKGREGNYKDMKRTYKKLYEDKKKEQERTIRERMQKQRGRCITINRERRKKELVDESIKMEEWRDHFMNVIGGMGEKVERGREARGRDEEESDLEEEEVKRVLRGLKVKKAMGIDGIPNEEWQYGGENVESYVWELCKRIWKGDGWLEV